jgi:uncharacterized membrane protein YGL010W
MVTHKTNLKTLQSRSEYTFYTHTHTQYPDLVPFCVCVCVCVCVCICVFVRTEVGLFSVLVSDTHVTSFLRPFVFSPKKITFRQGILAAVIVVLLQYEREH